MTSASNETRRTIIDHEISNKYLLKDKLFFFLYALYFILTPCYLWKSGLPQIADLILVLLILTFALFNKFTFSFSIYDKQFLLCGLFFVFYVFTVNLIWILLLQYSKGFLLFSTFYLYNFLVAAMVIALYNRYKEMIIKITYYAVLTSVFIQTGSYFIGGGFSGARMAGSFNNPNQLGQYALMTTAILIFASDKIEVKTKWFFIGILSSLLLIFASLSKAAILSYLGMVLFYLLTKSKNKKLKMNIFIVVILTTFIVGVIYNTTSLIQDNQLIGAVQKRIEGIGSDNDDSLEGRGYNRITENPQYWIFGAGEGKNDRFLQLQNMEFHSTLGNIQVSYGIIGLMLFISLVFIALKKDKYRSWYIILFIMIFGLTHNGIRNSLLWILLALMVASYSSKRTETK